MEKNKNFKPYIPSSQILPEFTLTSAIMGIIMAVVFGAANAYLGLRVGLTVSASIPAAVISMGVIRIILRKNSILESNIVQTIGSAGESLAAGAIFTLPALFLWAREGVIEKPSLVEISLISLLGGLLGVFFMIPLRNALIVREHNVLPYPEGTAAAEVLLAGENGGASATSIFAGMGFSALFKLVIDGFHLVPGEVSTRIRGYYGAEIGTQVYPAVLSVGYICGIRIASYMFAGGLLSWVVIIPMMLFAGENQILSPATETIGEMYVSGGASAIWSTYIRYIGAGALATGGIMSLLRSAPLIFRTFRDAIKEVKTSDNSGGFRTDSSVEMKYVIVAIAILTFLIWLVPAVPVSFVGALVVVAFGFFFATVSSRMVGLVGSSNNPVSGMAIATLLFATLILKVMGASGGSGMHSAAIIGSVICIVAAIAGDTSQDLKTGYIIGATPKKQQYAEVLGVVSSAFAIGVTLYILDSAWGFGSDELSAPQATLMKMIVEGVMNSNLPWNLVFIGTAIAVVAEVSGIPVLPFAIGVYLPVQLNACIMVGGIIRWIVEKLKKDDSERVAAVNNGVLFCSGMIAGEGIVGIILAVLAIFGVSKVLNLSGVFYAGPLGSIAVFLLLIASVLFFSLRKNKEGQKNEF